MPVLSGSRISLKHRGVKTSKSIIGSIGAVVTSATLNFTQSVLRLYTAACIQVVCWWDFDHSWAIVERLLSYSLSVGGVLYVIDETPDQRPSSEMNHEEIDQQVIFHFVEANRESDSRTSLGTRATCTKLSNPFNIDACQLGRASDTVALLSL